MTIINSGVLKTSAAAERSEASIILGQRVQDNVIGRVRGAALTDLRSSNASVSAFSKFAMLRVLMPPRNAVLTF